MNEQEILSNVPKLYETENIEEKEKMIMVHYQYGASNWYITEYHPEKKTFFGFAILNEDYQCAEWGYISKTELDECGIGIDLLWEPIKASSVEGICKARGWKHEPIKGRIEEMLEATTEIFLLKIEMGYFHKGILISNGIEPKSVDIDNVLDDISGGYVEGGFDTEFNDIPMKFYWRKIGQKSVPKDSVLDDIVFFGT